MAGGPPHQPKPGRYFGSNVDVAGAATLALDDAVTQPRQEPCLTSLAQPGRRSSQLSGQRTRG